MAEVCIDIDLEQVSTDELVEALNYRSKNGDIRDLSLVGISDVLEIAGCPKEILEPLNDWLFQKCLTKEDLDKWISWANQL